MVSKSVTIRSPIGNQVPDSIRLLAMSESKDQMKSHVTVSHVPSAPQHTHVHTHTQISRQFSCQGREDRGGMVYGSSEAG